MVSEKREGERGVRTQRGADGALMRHWPVRVTGMQF